MVSNKNVERKQIMRVNLRTAEDVKQGRMKTSCSSTTDKRRKSLSLKIEERTPKKERDNTRRRREIEVKTNLCAIRECLYWKLRETVVRRRSSEWPKKSLM